MNLFFFKKCYFRIFDSISSDYIVLSSFYEFLLNNIINLKFSPQEQSCYSILTNFYLNDCFNSVDINNFCFFQTKFENNIDNYNLDFFFFRKKNLYYNNLNYYNSYIFLPVFFDFFYKNLFINIDNDECRDILFSKYLVVSNFFITQSAVFVNCRLLNLLNFYYFFFFYKILLKIFFLNIK